GSGDRRRSGRGGDPLVPRSRRAGQAATGSAPRGRGGRAGSRFTAGAFRHGLRLRRLGAVMRVAIIDYGSGNLRSAVKSFERSAREAGVDTTIDLTSDADRVATADRIVLPGVGAYADCRAGLDAVPGMVEALNEAVVDKGRPFFGICVGMQLMSARGLEK